MANVQSELLETPSDKPEASAGDVTGRDRLLRNVLASWAGHMVFVVSGFIMPRFIDRSIGQTALGVWDFGWSLVSYFGLVQVGLGSSVHPYVAKYRATNDIEGVNRAVSSAVSIQMVTAGLAWGLTILATWATPVLFRHRLADHVVDAQWLIFLLGSGLAFQILLNPYVGVIVGCHRWDLHYLINSGFYAATVVAMISVLCLGGGLRSLAATYLCGTVLTELTRALMGHRVYPQLSVRLRNASLSQGISMLAFGGKTLLGGVSKLLLYQTNSMLIIAYLGPGALALYSRPKSLVSSAQAFINKFSFVLAPTASSLHAGAQKAELQELVIRMGRVGTYLSLPMVLFLSIMATPILHTWMGPRYDSSLVLTILAIGHLAEMTRQPLVNILVGINMHGRIGLIYLGAALASVFLGFITLGLLHWGIWGAALSVAMPLMLGNGILIPIYACHLLEIPVRRYAIATNRGPLLCAVPFTVCLVVSRIYFAENDLAALLTGGCSGGLVIGLLYWRYVLPDRLRRKLSGRVAQLFSRRVPQAVQTRRSVVG